jgi:hypothetical protein
MISGMATAVPVAGARRSPGAAAAPPDDTTAGHLLLSVGWLRGLRVLGYEPRWWDGAAWTPCLVVQGGRRDRRLRVVETSGEIVLLPWSERGARRRLVQARWSAAVRRFRERAPLDLRLTAEPDGVTCAAPNCGGVLAVAGADGAGHTDTVCPVCGRPA